MKTLAASLTAGQRGVLLDLIVRVLCARGEVFAMPVESAGWQGMSGAEFLGSVAASALRCRGVLPVHSATEDKSTLDDTQNLAAVAVSLDPQGGGGASGIALGVAGDDRAQSVPPEPVKSPCRAAGQVPVSRNSWGEISVDLSDGIKEQWVDAYASAIENEKGVIATLDGAEVIGIRPKGNLGEYFYNRREYAKHLALFRRYLAVFPYIICFTKTAGTEYDIGSGLVDGGQFVADMKHRLARLAKNHGSRYMLSCEFGAERHLHCHGMIFFKELPLAMRGLPARGVIDGGARAFLNEYLDFQSFEKVEVLDRENEMGWFNYCHKYTAYTAAQWLRLDEGKDAEQKAAARTCMENLMLCQKNHVSHWASSGAKGLPALSAQDNDVLPTRPAPFEQSPAQDNGFSEIVRGLECFARGDCPLREGLLTLQRAVKMLFPCACIDRYIVNGTYRPVDGSKLAQWREKALRGSKIKTCDCFFKQLYFRVSDLLVESV